jgi:double zinc ribbon protein
MLELIAGILLAAGAVYFVLRPILHPDVEGRGTVQDAGVDEGADPDDDLSPRAVALRALKEIEFDRATGKLSDADYDTLRTKYTAEALAALRAASREPGAGSRSPGPSGTPVGLPAPVCPTHGPRPESDAAFCSECGRRLAIAPGYCARCGMALEHDAHYCHACGARVAA